MLIYKPFPKSEGILWSLLHQVFKTLHNQPGQEKKNVGFCGFSLLNKFLSNGFTAKVAEVSEVN